MNQCIPRLIGHSFGDGYIHRAKWYFVYTNNAEELRNLRAEDPAESLGKTSSTANSSIIVVNGEGGRLKRARRRGTKDGGANGIRYPGSPSCKRCRLGVRTGTARSSAAGKPLSLPPWEDGRKAVFLSGLKQRSTKDIT